MQSETHSESAQETVANRPTWFIIKFLALWFASLIVVLAVTLLNDINWTKPFMERSLSKILNRQVQLGKVNWSLGLNGIAIGTKTLEITDKSGAPFLTAKQSEIGLSVLGLIERKIVITYIDTDQANLHVVKTGKNTWNFDDLIQTGPEIRLLQMTGGKIGVFDQSTQDVKNRIAPIELEKVELKLNFPKTNRRRPFFLSFVLPASGYSSTFRLDGLGVGELENWQSNRYTFKADADRVNPRDLERVVRFVSVNPEKLVVKHDAKPSETKPQIASTKADEGKKRSAKSGTRSIKKVSIAAKSSPNVKKQTVAADDPDQEILDVLRSVTGLFSVKIEGDGSFDKGIKATIDTSASGLQIDDPTLGRIDAGTTVGTMEANVSNDKLVWSDLILKLRGMQMRSSGALSNWQKTNPMIQAKVVGNLPDLGVLNTLVIPKPGVITSPHGLGKLAETLKPAQLTGRAEVEIKIDGTKSATNLTTKIKTHDLAIKDMLTKAHEKFPILCAIGLSNQARIETDLRIKNSDRLDIINGRLVGPGTNLSATGWLDLKGDKGDLTITGDNIALTNAAVAISTNDGVFKQVMGCVRLPGKTSFTLGGKAAAYANLKMDSGRYTLDGKLKLKDAIFALKDNSLKLDKVDGNVSVAQSNGGGVVTLDGITGQMGDGKFQLDGKIGLGQAHPTVDITLHATRFDIKHLSMLMKLAQIQEMPVLTERHLYGRVKDVVLKVTGESCHPNIFFNAVPDDLYYQPPGLAKPLRAKAGEIVYNKDQLILREVALISNGKTIITSATIDKVSKECILTRVKAKTDSMELADINYYLSSTAMPPPMRKTYHDFLAKYKISSLSGKMYGDILCLIGAKGDVTFDGLIGCYKTAATISGYPLTRIEGIFAASGDQLLLQDLSGYLRGSRFSLDGYIDKYRSNHPNWRAEVAAKLAPRELLELIPHVTDELKTSRIDVQCKGPLSLRAKVQGNFDYNKIQYSLVADKKDQLSIEGRFGKIHQPADAPLTLDGLIALNKNTVELGDTHLLVGQTMISLGGLLTFPEAVIEPGKPEYDEKIHKNVTENIVYRPPPMVRLNFKIPQKSPISTLVSMIHPPLAKEIGGTIGGFLTLDGELTNPKIMSDLTVNDVRVAAFKISGLNGRLRSGDTSLIEGPKTQAISDAETLVIDNDAQSADPPKPGSKQPSQAVPSASVPSSSPAQTPPIVSTLESLTSKDSIIEIDSVKVRQLPITNLKAHVTLTFPEESSKAGPTLKIDRGQARLADGVMKFEVKLNPTDNHIWLNALFSDVSASRIGDELIGSPDEITGKSQAEIVLETHGEDNKKLVKNLRGHGSIEVENGIVSRFAHLETRLTQYNLLTQGIFGFNLNNLVQSVWPVRTGEFTSLNNKFSFANGSLKVEEMRFNGKDMRMWGTGTANLVNNKVKIEMAGKIPRVTGSRLGGGIGEVSKNLTLQKMMKVVTMGRLENLPSLPVLGAIATDKPRTFTFSVDSELGDPKTIARSIEKSFKWIQNKPDATAHPVPGIVTPI